MNGKRLLSDLLVLVLWITILTPTPADAAALGKAFSFPHPTHNATVPVLEEDRAQMGYIKVTDFASGEKNKYDALLVDDEVIYMSGKALVSMTGYVMTGDEHSAVSFKLPKRPEETRIKIDASGQVTLNEETFQVKMVEYDETYYYHLNQMLNLLGGEWMEYYEKDEDGKETDKGQLCYLRPKYNALDFVNQVKDTLYKYQIKQDALISSGDSSWGTAFAAGTAVVFNDFDMRILIPFVGDDMIIKDQYIEAFETLSVDDAQFVSSNTFTQVADMVEASDIDEMAYSLKAMEDIISLPDSVVNTVTQGKAMIDSIKDTAAGEKLFSMLKNQSSILSDTDIGAWGDVLEKVNNVADVLNVFMAAYQTWERGTSWSADHIMQLEVLQNVSSPANKDTQKYINSAADKLIFETEWPTGAALLQETGDLIGLAASMGIKKFTPLGPIIGIISGGVAIGKTFPEFKRDIESNDLKYMVNCLIKTEDLVLSEVTKAYNCCMNKYRWGTIEQEDLVDLKTKTKLALRINLRNAAMVYYLDSQLEGSSWKNSSTAQKLIDQIAHDYGMLTELEHASDWDYALRVSDWKTFIDSVGSTEGDIRDRFNKDIWYPADKSIGNATNYVQYQGKVYFWGFTGESFSESGTFGNYYAKGGVNNTLLAVDADDPDAVPEEILTADGTGRIGIWNDRLFYESNQAIKSVMLDGTDPKTYNCPYHMEAADDDNGILICEGYYGNTNGVALLNMTSGEVTWVADESYLIMEEDGIVYYYTNPSKGTMSVNCVKTDGSKDWNLGIIVQTLWDESEMSVMSSTCVDSAQIADDYLYLCYGSYAGTGGFLQGGEVSRLYIADPERSTGPEHIYGTKDMNLDSLIYVGSKDGVHTLYFRHYNSSANKEELLSMTVPSGTPVETTVTFYPKGYYYVDGNTICVHPDLSGTVQTVITPSDYSGIGSTDKLDNYTTTDPLLQVEGIYAIGDWLYYTAEKGNYSGATGWRYEYTRELSIIYRKHIKTGVVQELHRY